MEKQRLNLSVKVLYDFGGFIKPEAITKDGCRFMEIKVIRAEPAASLKGGGCGIRYYCRAQDMRFYIFLDDNLWFSDSEELINIKDDDWGETM